MFHAEVQESLYGTAVGSLSLKMLVLGTGDLAVEHSELS